MPPTLENPFTPKSALPTKRLFGGGEGKRKLSKEALERIKEVKEKFIQYGDKNILKPQVQFLYNMEKELIAIFKENGKELSKEEAEERLSNKIEVDEYGNIKMINLSAVGLKKLPDIDKLTNLQVLDCFHNQLTNLPRLDKLKYLENLDCSDNELEYLPRLEKLTNLKNLDCYVNKFSEQEKERIISQVPKNCKVDI